MPPRLLKSNLRRLVGGHVRARKLGHYLDFDVVVIPPGRHVTEFPTADAAFHPYKEESDRGEGEAALEIRLVPWIIFKISANEPLSKKLAAEIGSFWRAGVEQIWEIRSWNRTIALHIPGGNTRVFPETASLPPCPVLPGLSGKVADLFAGVENEEALPKGTAAGDESWRIPQQWERKSGHHQGKTAVREFAASPTQSRDLVDPYLRAKKPDGFRGVAELVLGSWVGRILLGTLALVFLTTVIYLVLETHSRKGEIAPARVVDPETVLTPEARLDLAKATVRAYFQTGDPGERLELVRHPEETRPRMLRFYGERPVTKDVISVFGTAENLQAGGLDFLVLPAYIEGKQADLFLEELKEGGYLVDWESQVGYNATLFPVFRSKADPKPTEFRVLATESDRYGGAFASKNEFLAVQLHFPDSDESALGYLDRASPDFAALEKLVTGQYRKRLRLVLARAKGPSAEQQVIITKLAGDSWLDAE